MKVEQLIAELQKLPAGTEVVIFDGRKNLFHEDGDGSSVGFYNDFYLFQDETIIHRDGVTPLAALSFENEDYNDGCLVHPLYLEALESIREMSAYPNSTDTFGS
jgi:hypothetical protein